MELKTAEIFLIPGLLNEEITYVIVGISPLSSLIVSG